MTSSEPAPTAPRAWWTIQTQGAGRNDPSTSDLEGVWEQQARGKQSHIPTAHTLAPGARERASLPKRSGQKGSESRGTAANSCCQGSGQRGLPRLLGSVYAATTFEVRAEECALLLSTKAGQERPRSRSHLAQDPPHGTQNRAPCSIVPSAQEQQAATMKHLAL